MTEYEWYIFFLCLIVFIALTALFSVLIVSIVKLTIKLIRSGVEDEELQKEKAEEEKKKCNVFDKVVSVFLGIVLTLLLIVSLFANLGGNIYFKSIPALQAVKSSSMAQKNPENTYLQKNHLDDQIQMFDLVFTHRLPDEFDLELYDIVVYEVEGTQIIHRIVGIEEPNEKHPGERRFTLQGDAIDSPDRFSVKYTQMKSIYRGERIAFVGSFVMFMQSPAGWLCILLAVFVIIASPAVERRIKNEKEKRLKLIEAGSKKTASDKKEMTRAGDNV